MIHKINTIKDQNKKVPAHKPKPTVPEEPDKNTDPIHPDPIIVGNPPPTKPKPPKK